MNEKSDFFGVKTKNKVFILTSIPPYGVVMKNGNDILTLRINYGFKN